MATTGIGIIGAGGFGLFCIEQCRLIPAATVVGVADSNPEALARVKARFDIPFTTTRWQDLLQRPDVHVVHIITPPSWHAEQAIACFAAGKHVFCEKPLAISMKDADAILATAAKHDVRVGIDFVMRYNPLYEAVRVITEEKLLGRPQRFLFENTAIDLPAAHWFWNPWLSGGIPVEHGVHFFDIFATLFGPGSLRWAGRACRSTGEEDKWLAVLQYSDQMFGSFYHAFDKPEMIERTWSVIDFARGYVTLEGWIPESMRLDAVTDDAQAQRLTQLFPAATVAAISAEEQHVLAEGAAMVVTQRVQAQISAGEKQALYGKAVQDAMADFIHWTQNPAHHPRVTGEDGREAVRVAIAVSDMARATAQA